MSNAPSLGWRVPVMENAFSMGMQPVVGAPVTKGTPGIMTLSGPVHPEIDDRDAQTMIIATINAALEMAQRMIAIFVDVDTTVTPERTPHLETFVGLSALAVGSESRNGTEDTQVPASMTTVKSFFTPFKCATQIGTSTFVSRDQGDSLSRQLIAGLVDSMAVRLTQYYLQYAFAAIEQDNYAVQDPRAGIVSGQGTAEMIMEAVLGQQNEYSQEIGSVTIVLPDTHIMFTQTNTLDYQSSSLVVALDRKFVGTKCSVVYYNHRCDLFQRLATIASTVILPKDAQTTTKITFKGNEGLQVRYTPNSFLTEDAPFSEFLALQLAVQTPAFRGMAPTVFQSYSIANLEVAVRMLTNCWDRVDAAENTVETAADATAVGTATGNIYPNAIDSIIASGKLPATVDAPAANDNDAQKQFAAALYARLGRKIKQNVRSLLAANVYPGAVLVLQEVSFRSGRVLLQMNGKRQRMAYKLPRFAKGTNDFVETDNRQLSVQICFVAPQEPRQFTHMRNGCVWKDASYDGFSRNGVTARTNQKTRSNATVHYQHCIDQFTDTTTKGIANQLCEVAHKIMQNNDYKTGDYIALALPFSLEGLNLDQTMPIAELIRDDPIFSIYDLSADDRIHTAVCKKFHNDNVRQREQQENEKLLPYEITEKVCMFENGTRCELEVSSLMYISSTALVRSKDVLTAIDKRS